ncbi:MAG TPA: TetR family transcriptional regulator [Candidatus Limnocylindria bacterium]
MKTQGVRRGRGRPPGESVTREAIVGEARRQFSELGYGRTTLRGIARGAGVDPRLLLHYFGSKQELFMVSVELPIEPALIVETVFSGPPSEMAGAAARLMVSVIDDPQTRRPLLALLRAAVTEPEAAELIRRILTERLLLPMAERVGGTRPELRASLVASQLVGMTVVRYVVGIQPLADASREQLIRALEPAFEHYFHGDWVVEEG